MVTNNIVVNMTPSHPGDFIRTEVIEETGMSVTRAAELLGVRRATLSALLNRKSRLSPDMARRVERSFGLSMDMLLRMQAWHDAARMRAHGEDAAVRRSEPHTYPSPTGLTSLQIAEGDADYSAHSKPE